MSHLSILRTQFRDRAVLLDALRTLGYEVNPSANQKISANGRARTVEFTVTPPYSAPIGFIPGKNGYRIVADWFLIQLDRKAFTAELTRTYAYLTALSALTTDGFSLVEEMRDESGRIRLILRRTS